MKYTIVPAAPEHLPYLPEPLRSINRSSEEFVTALNNGLLWVVVDNAHIPVAFLLASIIDGCIHIAEFDVHPDHGKRGVGTKLLDHVLAVAKARAFPAATLTTFEHLPWNAPFYRKRGFEVIGVDKIGDELAQIVRNEKALGMRRRVAMKMALLSNKPVTAATAGNLQ
jgi:GNAT superfamily N-acetyltransferase